MAQTRTQADYKKAYEHWKSQGDLNKANQVANLYRASLQQASKAPQVQAPVAPAPAQNKPDNAFEYSADQAQRMVGKGVEAGGKYFNLPTVQKAGSSIVAQQDKDIAQGGYTPSYTKSLRETWNEGGLGSAMGWLTEKTAENSVSGGTALAGAGLSAAAATVSVPAAALIGAATLSGGMTMGAGEAAFEQEEKNGDYDAGLALGVGALIGLLDRFGAAKVIPKSKLQNMTVAEITSALKKKGFADAAAEVVKKTTIEGLTETAQESAIVGAAASRGGEYTPGELVDRGIESFALGSTNALAAQGVVGTVKGTANALTPAPAQNSTTEAQAAFAQRLRQIADGGVIPEKGGEAKKLDLKNVDIGSEEGARAAMDAAHLDIVGEIQTYEKILRDRLKTNTPLLEDFTVLMDQIKATVGLKASRNKTKSFVTKANFEAVDRLVGDTQEGQTLLNLMRESQEQTRLHNTGYVGGVSQYTDLISPIAGQSGYNPSKEMFTTVKSLGTLGAAASTGGTSLIPQAAIAGGGRLIDKATGRRSTVDRFVSQNEQGAGFGAPGGVSLRAIAQREEEQRLAEEQQAQAQEAQVAQQTEVEEQQKREAAEQAFDQQMPPNPKSPQGIYEIGTGLNTQGLLTAMEVVYTDPQTHAFIKTQIESLHESMVTGSEVTGFESIRNINNLLNNNEQMGALRVRQPDEASAQAGANVILTQQQINYERGVLANQAAAKAANEALQADPNVSDTDKGHIGGSLFVLESGNLGSTPRQTLNSMVERLTEIGVADEALQAHFFPIAYQISEQQKRKPKEGDPEINFSRMPDGPTSSIPAFRDAGSVATLRNQMVSDLESAGVMQGELVNNLMENPLSDSELNSMSRHGRDLFKAMDRADFLGFDSVDGAFTALFSEDLNNFDMPQGLKSALGAYVNKEYSLPAQKNSGEINFSRMPDGPALSQRRITNIDILPSEEAVQQMRDGSYKRPVVRTKSEAGVYLQERWQEATGRSEPFEYTPENIDMLSDYMSEEAINNLGRDSNAIGWYDRKLKSAKAVVSLVDPRVVESPENELAFDFILAVTSNGQAVVSNFAYASEIFDTYISRGRMPVGKKEWDAGGERNQAMLDSFNFWNEWHNSGSPESIAEFFDTSFTRGELDSFIKRFNAEHGTDLQVSGSELVTAQVKGSFVLGPKIGQGFYQNIRGNYDALTMDIWWMRMWNRLVGDNLKKIDQANLTKARSEMESIIKNAPALEKKLINDTKKRTGIKFSGIYKNSDAFDGFLLELDKTWQSYFKQFKKDNNKNPDKPALFKKTGTHRKNLSAPLQETPRNGSERQYMRDVTSAAIQKLGEKGYNINTADFQALMWYPEKQLFRALGVSPGQGQDNDYLDAAIILAEKNGVSNDQIKETLTDIGRRLDNSEPSTRRQDGSVGERSARPNGEEAGGEGAGGETNLSIQPSAAALDAYTNPAPRPIPKPTVRQTQLQFDLASDVFDIGAKGSKYENGINNVAEAERLMEALGITFALVETAEELNTAAGADLGANVAGFYKASQTLPDGITRSADGKYLVAKGFKETKPVVGVRKIGSTQEQFHTLLHEIGHHLEGTSVLHANLGYKRLRDEISKAYDRSTTRSGVRKEIDNLQEIVNVNGLPVRPGGESLRQMREVFYGLKPRGQDNSFFSYVKSDAEIAVDPVWVYMTDPKLLKRVAPQTAKMIQKHFRRMSGDSAKSMPVSFHANPVVVALAFVIAAMAKMGEEEEEKQGILAQQPGALSA